MTNGVMIGIFFLVLLLLMLSGMPIAYSLGIASALYMVYMKTSLAMVAQRMVNGANSFTMLAIPFFFMAGDLMNISGVTDKIVDMARALVGHMKGGLAQVNIVASVFFAGVSGSAPVTAVAESASVPPTTGSSPYPAPSFMSSAAGYPSISANRAEKMPGAPPRQSTSRPESSAMVGRPQSFIIS